MKSSANKSMVFIPHSDGTKNIHAATAYGEPTIFTRRDIQTDPEGIEDCINECKDWLGNYNPNTDYILLIGDPVLISIVSALTATIFTRYTLLKWDRQTKTYIKVVINLGEEDF